MGNKFYTLVIIFFMLIGKIYSQCDVRIVSSKNAICLGDSIKMKATGGCGLAFFVDFNDSTLQGLLSNNTHSIGKYCKPSLDNTFHLWMGTITGQNLVYTPPLNLTAGGYSVRFDMLYGEDNAGGNCDGPLTIAEAVHLQYSIDNGATWVTMQTYNPNGGHDPSLIDWNYNIAVVPAVANTNSTRFRWAQLSSITANTAVWGIDNIKVQRNVPTQYNWSTSYIGEIHPDVSPNNTITYWVTATSGSQSATDSIVITVNPRPTSTFATSRPLCKNTLIDLIYTGNADSTATFNWIAQNSQQLINPNKKNAQALWSKTGQYLVSLSVIDKNCPSYLTQVELLVSPLISFYISNSQGCEPLEVSFTGNVEPSNSLYFWDFKDGSLSTDVNPKHTYQNAGNYGLTLISTTDSGCVDTVNFAVLTQVFPKPIVNFSFSPPIVPWSNPEAAFKNLTTFGNNYQWDFGDFGSSNNANPNHVYNEKGVFNVQLIATSDKGCIDSISKPIRVADDEFKTYNIITPNGDGLNDNFIITNLESLKSCDLSIFNRWGTLIYQSSNYQNDWNANNNADGVYYYIIKYESYFGHDEKYGNFHVIRQR